MIKCPKCGKELPDGTKFCSKCGAPLSDVKPEEPKKEEAKKEEPKKEEPKKEEPKKEEPKKAEPKKAEPKKAEPKKEEPKKEEPKKEEPKKEEPKKEEPKKEEPKKEEPKKEEPKKEEAKKEEPKKEEAKKDEAKKDEAKKDEAKKDGEEDGEKIPKKWITYGAIAAAVVVFLILLIALCSGSKSSGKHYAIYLKDKEIMYSNLKPKAAKQVTTKLSKEGDISTDTLVGAASYLRCTLSKDGKTIFFPDRLEASDDGITLYFRNLSKMKKDPVKVDSSMEDYYVNETGTLVTYTKSSDDLYQYNVKKEEKEKIASEVADFRIIDDGAKVVYRKNTGELYLWTKKGSEKLDSDISKIQAVYDKTIYYVKDGSLFKKVGTKDKEKIASEISSVIRTFETGEVYYVKNDGGKMLYFYNGKDSEKIAEYYAGYVTSSTKATAVAFYANESESSSKSKLYVAIKKNVNEVDLEDVAGGSFASDGKSLYVIADLNKDGTAGDLYRISVSGSKIGKPEKYDTDVTGRGLTITDGKVLYFKDYKKNAGDLYCNKKKVDSDVYAYSINYCKDTKQIFYMTDYNSDKEIGTLKVSKNGGKAKKIQDDVYDPVVLPNGYVLYLYDYSTKYSKGDLYLYKGGKPVKLDEEVSVVLSVN